MSEQHLPPIPPNIVELTGPLFLGYMFNWALFGALTVQTYIYYLAFPRDKIFPAKALVAAVYIYEVLQSVLSTRDSFRNFGYGYGNMISLNDVGWLWFSVPVMTGIISAVTQLFYAWRIWILGRQLYIPSFICVLALVQGGAGIWSGVNAHLIGIFSEVQHHNEKPTIVWLGGTALCDVIIAASMLYYLSKSRTGFRQTNAILVKLIRITIETGFVTAAVAVVDLAMFLAYEEVNYHLTPAIALSKIYSNSLLVLLNARVRIVGGRNVGIATNDGTLSWVPGNPTGSGSTFVDSETHQLSTISKNTPSGKPFSVAVTQERTTDGSFSDAVDIKNSIPL